MRLRIVLWLLGCGVCVTATAAGPDIPALNWTERSDWVNVQTDIAPAAVGNGVADDTAAIQKAFDGVTTGSVLYFPPGTYRLTATLKLQPKQRVTGAWIVGHGRDTRLVWDGPEGQPLWLDHGVAHSRYAGLSLDGRGKATVGLHHHNGTGGFETEVDLRHMAFRNFTDTGLLASGAPATAEVVVENSLFENCQRGMAFLNFNDYDWTIDGCEFRRCQTGIQCDHGNTYIRNSHFEGSTAVDIRLSPEHGCSVRRCTSSGSRQFIHFANGVSPLTVQDCQVSGWSHPAGAISLSSPAAMIFDCVFTNPPGKNPPVQLGGEKQRLLVSQNVSAATAGVVAPKVGQVYEIPAGRRQGTLTSASQHFLRDTATVPTKVFDVRVEFGAKGDGRADDTGAIQQAIDAARAHGRGAIAYLPTGSYVVTRPLRISGADYTVGGTGFRTGLAWRGPEGGSILEVTDPQRVTLENLNIGSHDVGQGMKNACDILQTGTAASSEVTYDDVSVFGMYQRAPFKQGLCLRDLRPGAVVRVLHVQGNIRLQNAARATVLLGNSYEGSVVVEGKAQERDGFLGILTRLGTSCTHALYIKDNHSLVASDFYIEQADNAYSLEGSSDDPPGRLTLQTPKLQMSKRQDGQPNTAFDIRGYHGRIAFGPAQFYVEPTTMPVVHRGTRPLEMLLWGCSFYDAKLAVQKDDAARIQFLGCNATGDRAAPIEDTLPPNALAPFAAALDDLRRLGEVDLRLNHPVREAGDSRPGWRGVFFNPQVADDPNFPWLIHYKTQRAKVRTALSELRADAGVNLVDVHILIPHSLRVPAQGNRVGERVEQWANTAFLDNVAQFVDDCHTAGLAAELDLVDNRWIPHTLDPAGHIGKPGNAWWPVADQTPWEEASEWYRQMIEYIEARAAHPEAIAMWCLLGNYHWGAAEPMLWDDTNQPEIGHSTERFLKAVWPVFRSAGKRPKAAPILLPIFAAGGYWEKKTPGERLAGFTNLKRWLVDDLQQPPDYWVMSTYPYCDPAPDGFSYLRKIVEIFGSANAGRIVSTDLKGAGHEDETRDTILRREGRTGADILRWHLAKCAEYGFAGWWIWAYQDTPTSKTGLRTLDGRWKDELVREIVSAKSP